jgi:hypothetical protein
MPEAKAASLAAHLFEVRWPGRQATEEELRRYSEISVDTLTAMIEAVERASEEATSRRKVPGKASEKKEALRKRQEKALAGLDELAGRIAARQDSPARALVSRRSAVPAAHDRLENALKLLAESRRENSIVEALQVRLALDELTTNWRKTGADELADIILKRGQGNLISVLQMKASSRAANTLKAEVVERYLEFALLKTSWGVIRLLDRKLIATAGGNKAVHRLLEDHTLRSSVFEPSFLTDPFPRITATAATESLAKLYLFGSEFKPTRVISVGQGSEMIGQFMRSELRIQPEHSFYWDTHRRTLDKLARNFSDQDRVLVVSDVAGSTREFSILREALEKRTSGASVAFAALAAQATTYEAMRPGSVVFFANLTAEHDARLPWVRAGSYHRTRASHFFGHSAPSPLRIARDFFASVTSGLMALVK